MNADAVHMMRERAREGLGVNVAFVDDEMNLMVALAQRAVLAGLASDARPDALKRMQLAAEPHRAAHETALRQQIYDQADVVNSIGGRAEGYQRGLAEVGIVLREVMQRINDCVPEHILVGWDEWDATKARAQAMLERIDGEIEIPD